MSDKQRKKAAVKPIRRTYTYSMKPENVRLLESLCLVHNCTRSRMIENMIIEKYGLLSDEQKGRG